MSPWRVSHDIHSTHSHPNTFQAVTYTISLFLLSHSLSLFLRSFTHKHTLTSAEDAQVGAVEHLHHEVAGRARLGDEHERCRGGKGERDEREKGEEGEGVHLRMERQTVDFEIKKLKKKNYEFIEIISIQINYEGEDFNKNIIHFIYNQFQ